MYSQNVFILGHFWIYKVQSSTVDTKTILISLYSDLSKEIHTCPKCVIELCRSRADILKPTLDRTLVLRRALKYKQNPQCRSFGVDMLAEKELIFI